MISSTLACTRRGCSLGLNTSVGLGIIAAKNAATVAPGTDYIVAEDVAKGAKFVVVYRTKATDIYVIADPGSDA